MHNSYSAIELFEMNQLRALLHMPTQNKLKSKHFKSDKY